MYCQQIASWQMKLNLIWESSKKSKKNLKNRENDRLLGFRWELASWHHSFILRHACKDTFVRPCVTYTSHNCESFVHDVSYHQLVYTTPVNSAFRAIWLVTQSPDIKCYSPPGGKKQRTMNVLSKHQPFRYQECPISNFLCSLTRNMTSHSMENFAFHSLLRWEMIMLPIRTTSLINCFLGSWENVLSELGSASLTPNRQWTVGSTLSGFSTKINWRLVHTENWCDADHTLLWATSPPTPSLSLALTLT